METIESKIKGDRYVSEEDLIADFKLMFHNCQRYNEEGSVIYKDAATLEKVSDLQFFDGTGILIYHFDSLGKFKSNIISRVQE